MTITSIIKQHLAVDFVVVLSIVPFVSFLVLIGCILTLDDQLLTFGFKPSTPSTPSTPQEKSFQRESPNTSPNEITLNKPSDLDAKIGEVNTNNRDGLRILVNLILQNPNTNEQYTVRITTDKGNTLTGVFDSSNFRDDDDQDNMMQIPFLFYRDIIQVGEEFEVCVNAQSTHKISCVKGMNHPENKPEIIYLQT